MDTHWECERPSYKCKINAQLWKEEEVEKKMLTVVKLLSILKLLKWPWKNAKIKKMYSVVDLPSYISSAQRLPMKLENKFSKIIKGGRHGKHAALFPLQAGEELRPEEREALITKP